MRVFSQVVSVLSFVTTINAQYDIEEAAWPIGLSAGFEIRGSRVQIPFWPLADGVRRDPSAHNTWY